MQRHHKSILVVDDDFDVRTGIQEVLEDEGHVVVPAANGAEAMDLLTSGLRPALILLDLMMPIMDGFEFCHSWARDSRISTIPLFIVSADRDTAGKAKTCGATGYLAKPIELDDLLSVAARYTCA